MTRTLAFGAAVGCILGLVSLAAQGATPKEAVGFFGTATGVVKSTAADGSSFVLTVSKAVADKPSKVTDTAAIVGKELTLGTRMPKGADGTPAPHVDDVAYIKSLKAGDAVVVQVFAVRSDPTILRMQKPGEKAGK